MFYTCNTPKTFRIDTFFLSIHQNCDLRILINFDTALKSCVMISMNPSIPLVHVSNHLSQRLFTIFVHTDFGDYIYTPNIWKKYKKI